VTDELGPHDRARHLFSDNKTQKVHRDSSSHSSQLPNAVRAHPNELHQFIKLSGPKQKFFASSLGHLLNERVTREVEEKKVSAKTNPIMTPSGEEIRVSEKTKRMVHFAVRPDPEDPAYNTVFRTVGPRGWYAKVFMETVPFNEESTLICAEGILSGRDLRPWERDRIGYEVFVNKNDRLLELLSPSESFRKSYKVIRPLELMTKHRGVINAVFSQLPEKSWVSLSSFYRSLSVDPPHQLTQQLIRWLELQGSHHAIIRHEEMGICPDLKCTTEESGVFSKSDQHFESPWSDTLPISRALEEPSKQNAEPVEIHSNGRLLGTYSQTNLGYVFSSKQTRIRTKFLEVEITRSFPTGDSVKGETTLTEARSGQKITFPGSFARAWVSPDSSILLFLLRSGELVQVGTKSGIHVVSRKTLGLGDLYLIEIAFSENPGEIVVYSKKGHFTVFNQADEPRSFFLDFFPRTRWKEIEHLLNTACPQDIDTGLPTVTAKSTSLDVYRFDIVARLKQLGFTAGLSKLKNALVEVGVSDSTMLLRPGTADELKARGVPPKVIDALSWCLHSSVVRNMDPLEVNSRMELAALEKFGWKRFPVARPLRIISALRLQQPFDTNDALFTIDNVTANSKGWAIHFGNGFVLHLDKSSRPVMLGVPFTANTLYGEGTKPINLDTYQLDPKSIELASSYLDSLALP
jgi:hypothetical protein